MTETLQMSRFEPSAEEKAEGMITKNARQCTICGCNADLYINRFECQNNSAHVGDLIVGIFSDLSYE